MVAAEAGQTIVYAVVGVILVQGAWMAVLTYFMFKRAEARRARRETKEGDLEEVFVIHRSGLLLKHLSRSLRPNMDTDVLSNMLRALQEFVKDALREEGGELNEMTYGDLAIHLTSGLHVTLAVVVRGKPAEDLVDQMRAALRAMEQNHGDQLRVWSGRMSDVWFVEEYLEKLLNGEYKTSRPEKPAGRRLLPLPRA